VSWETIVPKRIVDLVAIPREDRLLLEWSVPKENTDKSPLTDLAGFKILRSEGTLVGNECRGCGEKTTVVHEIKLDPKEEPKKKRMAIFFEDLVARKVYVYQVVSINRRGYPSSPSNPVTVYWDYSPQAPRMVKGERGDKRVDLSWEPAEGATGYNVYRRLEEGEFLTRPLNREPLITTHYSDLNVENEKKYIYSVRAVRKVVKTDVEGKGSLGVPVTPTDLVPPAAPVGLVAIPLKNGMELNWRRNREPDLLGYYVYRRKPGEEEFKRLNESPVTKETYLDKEVVLQQEYEYAVTAVDNSVRRNESPRSEEVRVKYLY
jgi:fibronectin type 3 domain-containing protein